MIAARIASHGIINGNVDEENKFSLGGLPFSIYIRPKTTTDVIDVVLSCKLYQEDDKKLHRLLSRSMTGLRWLSPSSL